MHVPTTTQSHEPAISAWAIGYAGWIYRHARTVLWVALLVSLGAGVVAERLAVHADFSYLLPPNSESVQHLRRLEKRARVFGTVMVAVQAQDPQARERAAHALYAALQKLPKTQVSSIMFDQHVARQFAWDNRFLFVPLSDLQTIHDALAKNGLEPLIRAQNPLVDDLDADADEDDAQSQTWRTLMEKLDKLQQEQRDPGELVSHDKTVQMMVLQTPFPAGDVTQDEALLETLNPLVDAVQQAHPDVKIGLAGDVLTSSEEHHSILAGMLRATLLTIALVLLGMWLYFRSWAGVASLAMALTTGTLLTFMLTYWNIGYLNIATAFLASIVLGNGVNFGIVLLARYAEALRSMSTGTTEAATRILACAIDSTWRGTLAAAMTASVAYLSLMVTDFRGFHDFGWIGGIGMALCWLTAYTVLPACLAVAQQYGFLRVRNEPALGRFLASLLPRNLTAVVLVGLSLTAASGAVAWHYLAHDPYEANFKNLRSDSPALLVERHWMGVIDEAFGRGISGGFVIGFPDIQSARKTVERLRALDEGKPEDARLFSRLNALQDAVPPDQTQKIQLLQAIRHQLSDEALADVPKGVRRKILSLRPPAELKPLSEQDVPEALAWPFIETDGSRGKLVLAMSGWGYEIWNAHDLVRFSDKVRGLELGPDTLLGGLAFVFADMLRLVEHDGPRATMASIVGALAVIVLVVGWRRHGWITVLCGAAGTLGMIAICALWGLRVNFLDFVALPITIGIGIDYAVNICARARQEPGLDPRKALATTGSAVFLCSYTTIIGYGSLLLSTNKGIRSFGAAAILGEFTCLLAALILAPALLSVWHTQSDTTAEKNGAPAAR